MQGELFDKINIPASKKNLIIQNLVIENECKRYFRKTFFCNQNIDIDQWNNLYNNLSNQSAQYWLKDFVEFFKINSNLNRFISLKQKWIKISVIYQSHK